MKDKSSQFIGEKLCTLGKDFPMANESILINTNVCTNWLVLLAC